MDSKIGFIGGMDGNLLHTSNGGENWHKVEMNLFGDIYKPNISDIIFLKNTVLFTTTSARRDDFVYEIDKDGTNVRPFLTKKDDDVFFNCESYSIQLLHNNIYILDRNNLYKTSINKDN